MTLASLLPGTRASPTIPEALDVNTLFHLLRNQRRRETLHALGERDETSFRELAEAVASVEYDRPIEGISTTERKTVYVTLYQNHVPELEDCGLVERDRDTGTVCLTPAGRQVVDVLADIETRYVEGSA